MQKPNEYRAYFTITGELDPDALTSLLGLQPSSAWRKGSVNERTGLVRKANRWNLASRLDGSNSLEDQIEDVLAQIRPVGDKVSSLLTKFEGWIQLVGYFHENFPGLTLNPGSMIELASLNLGMDFDFYYLYSDAREDS
jgi:hypothetical protein